MEEDIPLNQKKLFSALPVYSILPIIAMIGMNCLAYFGTRLISAGRFHYNIESPLDHLIPVIPAFVVIYILAFAQWFVCYFLIACEKKEYCYRYFLGEFLAKAMCLAIFIILPTTLNRPEITGNGIFEKLLRFIYSIDAPDNLFPSIHCLESWMCWRGCRKIAWLPGWFSRANLVFTLLVFASTVFCKQHVLIDIAGGIAVAEIGLLISSRILRNYLQR